MELSTFTSLKEISKDTSVRDDAHFIRGMRQINDFTSKSKLKFNKLASSFSKDPRNGRNTKESSYSMEPTEYIYLTVDDIGQGRIYSDDFIYLNEIQGREFEASRLYDNDIIITRSGTVGKSCLFHQERDGPIFIPSGYLTIIAVDQEKIIPEFAVEYFNSPLLKLFFNTYSCGKNTRNISQENIKNIPFPDITTDEQEKILNLLRRFDDEIDVIKQSIPDTQEIIETIFKKSLDYLSFERFIQLGKKRLTIHFSNIGNGNNLRIDAKYNAFTKQYQGLIIISRNQRYPIRDLCSFMKRYKTKKHKKGYLTEKYILIEKGDVEPKTGLIVNEEWVNKIGSDKNDFGNCDILVSKIDTFLGHVILNDQSKPYIGTTEFEPYIIDQKIVDLQFLQYVLLSKSFLHNSKSIMTGKRQPRINPDELLSLRIQCPPLEEQKKAAESIKTQLINIKDDKARLANKIQAKDAFFMKYLADGNN